MYQFSHLIIRSISIRFSIHTSLVCLILVAVVCTSAFSNPLKLKSFELSGIVLNDKNSHAVLFDTEKRKEIILQVGDVVAGCILDYVRRSRVSFYCNDQIHTLTLRGLSADITSTFGKDIWSTPVAISKEEQDSLFEQPANFITTFNLVPHMQDGKLAAFEVKKVKAPDMAVKLDLQEGDLIVAVNGVSATDHVQFSRAFEQIKYTQIVELDLIREGQMHHKSYVLNN